MAKDTKEAKDQRATGQAKHQPGYMVRINDKLHRFAHSREALFFALEQLHNDAKVEIGIQPPRAKRRGAKRTDAEYVKLTHYLSKETHFAVKARLLEEDQGRDFSELIEELLSAWLKTPRMA
jgi:hypothetical protein